MTTSENFTEKVGLVMLPVELMRMTTYWWSSGSTLRRLRSWLLWKLARRSAHSALALITMHKSVLWRLSVVSRTIRGCSAQIPPATGTNTTWNYSSNALRKEKQMWSPFVLINIHWWATNILKSIEICSRPCYFCYSAPDKESLGLPFLIRAWVCIY